jgi:septum site-determining protein MinC
MLQKISASISCGNDRNVRAVNNLLTMRAVLSVGNVPPLSESVVTQTSSHNIGFRGRSFPVLALEPDAPLAGWMQRLDACLERSPAFFARKSVVVDVAALELDRPGVIGLVESLSERGIRIMGLTGVEPSWASEDIPPILIGGRAATVAREKAGKGTGEANGDAASKKLTPDEKAAFDEIAATLGSAKDQQPENCSAPKPQPEPMRIAPLFINAPVRSGQSIFYPEGDVTVVGSVASGADVVAGGSVHIYGTIRGRVMAGAYGETRARIFCRRLEAELLAIGGFYMTADEIATNMRSQAVQAWLENQTVKMAKLD